MDQTDRPNHPSLIGDWEETPPWQKSRCLPSLIDQTQDHRIDYPNYDCGSSPLPQSLTSTSINQILNEQNAILCGDATTILKQLPDEYFSCCITSPPYWDSRISGRCNKLGAECDPNEYIRNLILVFREVRRTLLASGTLWLVIGDSYASDDPQWWEMYKKCLENKSDIPTSFPNGFKANDMVGIPWRLAFELQNDGWHLRSDIIWSIPNYPLEPVKDRPARVHNYVLLLAKSEQHMYNKHGLESESRRTVWEIPTVLKSPISYTVFPETLVERCMKAGSQKDDVVLDPFVGSGTVGIVAKRLKRRYIGIDIDPGTVTVAGKRIRDAS